MDEGIFSPSIPGVMGMCEANAYLRRGDKDELYLEMVDKVVPRPDGLVLEDIFGRRKVFKGRILELALVDHRIVLEEDGKQAGGVE